MGVIGISLKLPAAKPVKKQFYRDALDLNLHGF
jgi:hypothetical protein